MNCYILTGGRSTRMGRSKTELFLPRVAAAAEPVFDEVIAVQRAGGETLSIPTIFESEHDGEAPVFGVLRALEHAAARAFILAVDHALITTKVLTELRRRVDASSAPLVMPVWNRVVQPLCAGYGPALIPLLRSRIEERKLDLRTLMDDVPAETFVFDGPELRNINTQAELAEVERHS